VTFRSKKRTRTIPLSAIYLVFATVSAVLANRFYQKTYQRRSRLAAPLSYLGVLELVWEHLGGFVSL